MLTLDSKFSDYFTLIKGIACEDAVGSQSKIKPDLTIGEVFAGYRDDPDFDEGWGAWCLETMGRELGSDIRLMIIKKMKAPMKCLKLSLKCPFLTEDESTLLKAKYEGQGEEIAKAVICLDAIQKSREFNAVRVEAVTTCKSVTEAKSLIETKTDVVTTVSVDSSVKSAEELKKILESDRAKVTLATNEVMRSQGFVDGKGEGSVSAFEEWFRCQS
jgi:hypothetical protein